MVPINERIIHSAPILFGAALNEEVRNVRSVLVGNRIISKVLKN